MRLKLVTTIVAGALAASALPALAQEGPLTPSGGQSNMRSSVSGGGYDYDRYEGGGEFLTIPGEIRLFQWSDDSVRGPLSPSGGRSGVKNPASNSN
jgi:hypothetical protein